VVALKGANVNFVVPSQEFICQATEEGNGWYNCTIPSTIIGSWPFGWYNLTMNATRDFYAYAETLQVNSFYINDAPRLSNPQVSPSSATWGTTFVFNVTLTDLDADNETVYFWLRRSGETDWQLIETKLMLVQLLELE